MFHFLFDWLSWWLIAVCPKFVLVFYTLKDQCSDSALIWCWWVAKYSPTKVAQTSDIVSFF